MDDQANDLGQMHSQFAPTGKATEEALHAIVLGDADAILVETKDGPRVYTLKDANEPYRHLVERMSEAAVVVEGDGTILYCNGRLASMLGRRDGLAGYCFLALVKGDQRSRAQRLLAAGLELQANAEIDLVANTGKTVAVRLAVAPMRFDERACVALVVTALDDIAALRVSEAALRESEERLRLTQEAAGVGNWDADLVADTLVWSSAHYALHNLNPATCPPSYEAWLAAVHPDDRERTHTIAQAGRDAGKAFEIDYRVPGPGGSQRWVTSRGTVLLDEAGQPTRVRGVSLDITERKLAEEALKAAKAEAERAVLARSKFLAAASHDLRQPVHGLGLMMAVLKPQVTTPTAARALSMMEQALDGLNGLLGSILDVSRLDAGVVMPNVLAVDLAALLGRLAEEYALIAGQKGLRIRFRAPALTTRSDPVLLERALRNLIENAIRYTPKGGILLGARRRGERLRIDVADTGIGIPADKQQHIFEEFYQVGNSGRDRDQGLGLGLSIVGRLARLLGAEVLVNSREGHGTVFSLVLPVEHAAPDAPKLVGAANESEGRLLIVEDDDTVRSGLQLLAESWGYAVTTAESGEAALAAAAAEDWRFDGILADYRLGPGLTGTEVAKEIRRLAGRAIPTLVVTGDTAAERIAEVHAGGFDMLHKPVGADELRVKLGKLLRGA